MSGSEPFFLDTNILVYAEDSVETGKRGIASELITRGIETGLGRISSQVLGEFLVTVTRKIQVPLDVETARRRVELLALMPVAAVDAPTVLGAISTMLRYGLSYWDALVLSSASASGARILYTEDLNHGQSYLGVQAIDPFRVSPTA